MKIRVPTGDAVLIVGGAALVGAYLLYQSFKSQGGAAQSAGAALVGNERALSGVLQGGAAQVLENAYDVVVAAPNAVWHAITGSDLFPPYQAPGAPPTSDNSVPDAGAAVPLQSQSQAVSQGYWADSDAVFTPAP